jgi:hypothetical protein
MQVAALCKVATSLHATAQCQLQHLANSNTLDNAALFCELQHYRQQRIDYNGTLSSCNPVQTAHIEYSDTL